MKKCLTLLFFSIISFVSFAQKITLAIHQDEPLQIIAPITEFRVIVGDKIVLGNELTISGGSGQYEEIWSSTGWLVDSINRTITVNPITTTDYTLRVIDKNGCIDDLLFKVKVFESMELDCKIKPTSCFGKSDGYASVVVIGGAPPFKILWSNGKTTDEVNGLSHGDYSVSVTDDMSQTQVRSFSIKEASRIITVKDTSICQGTTYNFAGINLTKAGQYEKTLKNADGCDSTVILNLSVDKIPEIPILTLNGNTLNSSQEEGNQWYKDGELLQGENKQTLLITQAGKYKVVVANSTGCKIESTILEIKKSNLGFVTSNGLSCQVYPNPNKGIFTVELDYDRSEVFFLELFSSVGKAILTKTVKHIAGKQQISFGKSKLDDGIYNLQIRFGEHALSRTVVINK